MLASELEKKFYDEKDVEKKIAIFEELKSVMYGDEELETYVSNMSRTIAYL